MIYQEIYVVETPTKTIHYLKNVTQVDNLEWLVQLCSPALIGRSKSITAAQIGIQKSKNNNPVSSVDTKGGAILGSSITHADVAIADQIYLRDQY